MLGWFKKKIGKSKEEEVVEPPEVLCETEELLSEESSSSLTDSERDFTAKSDPETLSVEAKVELAASEEKVRAGLLNRLKKGLARTRESFVKKVDRVFLGKKVIDADLLDELEEVLVSADLGIATVQNLLDEARDQVARKGLSDPQILKTFIKDKMYSYILQADKPAELVMPASGPFVVLVLGVNGVGKTTTIGKLAHKFKKSGSKVLLVAADTFRAAAIDQIKIWGERIGVEVSAQQPGADPSSVVFDALEYAGNRNFDVIIVDTAGRLHTKVNLMEELKKIKRVMNKKCQGAPHEIMLVLDSTTGQNAVSQAKLFNEAVELTGLALTKLDGTAKGGIIVNICRELNIPIRFIGIGEQMDDLRDFNPKDFVEALFS